MVLVGGGGYGVGVPDVGGYVRVGGGMGCKGLGVWVSGWDVGRWVVDIRGWGWGLGGWGVGCSA